MFSGNVLIAWCVFLGCVPVIAAEGSALIDTWYHAGGVGELAQRRIAINQATEGMNGLVRGRARDKLLTKTAPQLEIAIIDKGGKVTISTRDRRVTFATDGSPTRVSGEDGAGTIQATRKDGRLIVTARGRNGSKTTVYRLVENETRLTLDISMTNTWFEEPIRYQVEYVNDRRRASTLPK